MNNKDLEEVTVTNDFNKEVLTFKLNNPTGTKDLLSYQPDDVITDGKTYQMKVSSAFEITGDTITRTYPDGYSEEYISPSTAQIHAFRVDAVSLWGDHLVIEIETYWYHPLEKPVFPTSALGESHTVSPVFHEVLWKDSSSLQRNPPT